MGPEDPQDLVRYLPGMILVQFICLQTVEQIKCLHGTSQEDRKTMENKWEVFMVRKKRRRNSKYGFVGLNSMNSHRIA